MNRVVENNSTAQLCIAEDDPDDRLLICEALQENGISEAEIVFASDGVELMDLLQTNQVNPALILLDLNMPRMDGREALQEIKSSEMLSHIPVIIFTTSALQEDIDFAYRCGGNSYFRKPAEFSDLVEVMHTIKKYWFEKAVLPS